MRQEKPALTKASHYEEFGNNIALRYSSLNCLLLIYISGLPLSFSGTILNPIHSETDTERDLISKVSFFSFSRLKQLNLGQFPVLVHITALSTTGFAQLGGSRNSLAGIADQKQVQGTAPLSGLKY